MSVDLRAGQTLGPYRLLARVGTVGPLQIWNGHDERAACIVVIRCLAVQDPREPHALDRFRSEAQAIAQLRHPNILALHDSGEQDGWVYMVTPHLAVDTLADRLGRGPWGLGDALAILEPVAAALDYAHGRGIVHGDVQPAHILLPEHGHPLLTNFGTTYLHDRRILTHDRDTMIGMLPYISPEQARGHEVGPASDQYSLGVIAYELLTGSIPFTATTPGALLQAHVRQAPPAPHLLNPDLSPHDEAMLLQVLAKDPRARFRSALDFVKALVLRPPDPTIPSPGPLPHPMPIPPPPPGRRQRSGRRVLVAAVLLPAVVLGALFGAYGVSTRSGSSSQVVPPTAAPAARVTPSPAPGISASGGGASPPAVATSPQPAPARVTASPASVAASPAAGVVARPTPPPPPGAVVLRENFDDYDRRTIALSRSAFRDGEYTLLRASNLGGQLLIPDRLVTPASYQDASLTVDVRVIGDPTGVQVRVTCRQGSDDAVTLGIRPDVGQYTVEAPGIGKRNQAIATMLDLTMRNRPAASIQRGAATNRLELECGEDTIRMSVNGRGLTALQLPLDGAGPMSVQVDGPANREVRIDNLVITQR